MPNELIAKRQMMSWRAPNQYLASAKCLKTCPNTSNVSFYPTFFHLCTPPSICVMFQLDIGPLCVDILGHEVNVHVFDVTIVPI